MWNFCEFAIFLGVNFEELKMLKYSGGM